MAMRKSLRISLLPLMLLFQTPAMQGVAAAEPADGPVFLETTIDNRTPWVGEEVRLTYTLFFRNAAPGIEDRTKPEHSGLWVHEMEPGKYIDSTPVPVKGVTYRKAVIRQLRLIPMQRGRLSVSNYQLRCLIPKNGALSLDSGNDIETIVTAPTATIEARALPKPAPAGFSGAVGHFSISVSPAENRMHAGEPLTLFVTLAGSGNLDAQPALSIALPEGWHREESSAPKIVSSTDDPSRPSVTTKVTIIAEQAGSFRFRPVSMSLFNPVTERYETIGSNEVSIRVLPDPAPAPATVPQMAETNRQPSSGSKPDEPVTMIIFTLSGSVLALILSLHYRNKRSNGDALAMKESPKKRGAQKTQESPAVKPAASQKTPESMRRELYAALKKVGIANPEGMTSRSISAGLEKLGASRQTVADAEKLLAAIDHALYTPGKSSPDQLETMSRNTTKVIDDILSRH